MKNLSKNFKAWWKKTSPLLLMLLIVIAVSILGLFILYFVKREKFNLYWGRLKDVFKGLKPSERYQDKVGSKDGKPRGLRNNNPLNIKLNRANVWRGASTEQDDDTFVVFDEMKWGIRAAAVLLGNYFKIHHLDTLDKIVKRWSATDQEDYVLFVERKTGIKRHTELGNTPEVIKTLIKAMAHFENGVDVLTDKQIEEGVGLA